MTEYRPQELELKWQARWEELGLFRPDLNSDREKYYCLVMFPYPSGMLHVGHGRNYILGDAVARHQLMCGRNVLTPMGWDAFGLPAENAAIQNNLHPRRWTEENIQAMKRQLKRWGIGYDWGRELASCAPEYYKWTQWIFLQLLNQGLAYRKAGAVNWCPQCCTTLANEQVVESRCERCDTLVVQKELEQWYFRITELAERLLDDLDELEGWPERVLSMQENWIGRSEGATIYFRYPQTGETLPCFTTRPDTIFGVTFVALAPEHPWVQRLARKSPRGAELSSFVERVRNQNARERTSPDTEKEGFPLGESVLNPLTMEPVPLWVTNYALLEYGTGAVMGVPGHDQRDFLFARKYNIPIQVVIRPANSTLEAATISAAFEGDGIQVNSGEFDGLPNCFSKVKIVEAMTRRGVGKPSVSYRLRDWLISRQRYWGAPIPVVYCASCGVVPVPEKELPVLLPEIVEFKPTGRSPLADDDHFLTTPCPQCGEQARRESDTMDTFVDSSWYFLRYLSPQDSEHPFDKQLVNKWLPVDQYIGGVEHAIMHLLYARFITKVLYDLEWVEFEEPFQRLFTQGMICKESYRCPKCNRYVPEPEVEDGERHADCATAVRVEMAKMSKSRQNIVDPDELVEKFGADTQRLYTLFMGPPEKDAIWTDESVIGAHRFLNKLWETVSENTARVRGAAERPENLEALPDQVRRVYTRTHQTIRKVTADLEQSYHFNTAIAAIMELVNEVRAVETFEVANGEGTAVLKGALEACVLLLGPFVPHITEELWEGLGHRESLFRHGWPTYDEDAAREEEVEIVLQVDGKVRSHLTVPLDMNDEELRAKALANEKLLTCLQDREVRNVVVVPNRLVNVVTEGGPQQEQAAEAPPAEAPPAEAPPAEAPPAEAPPDEGQPQESAPSAESGEEEKDEAPPQEA